MGRKGLGFGGENSKCKVEREGGGNVKRSDWQKAWVTESVFEQVE